MRYQKILFLALCSIVLSSQAFAQPDGDKPKSSKQVINDDLEVKGSECVGFDCITNESYGFDTQRYKENNLRVHFDDTSNSASFPQNDWRIRINDSTNGGGSYFAVEDATAGRTPFRIEAGARTNALYVEDDGDIGIGTATPAVDLDIKTGNTPTVRLQQDGTSGFTPQTWDLAGNETNFFVRDATNGSRLPFRIQPSAPTNSIYIANDGDLGLGTSSPEGLFHVTNETNNTDTDDFIVKNGTSNAQVGIGTKNPSRDLHVHSGDDGVEFKMTTSTSGITASDGFDIQLGGTSGDVYVFNYEDGDMIFGTNAINNMQLTSTGVLNVAGAVNASQGTITPSDRNLKSNINNFEKGLAEVLQLNPVVFNYNGKAGIRSEKRHIGLIAQDLNKVMPEIVQEYEYKIRGEDRSILGKEKYLQIVESELKYLFINAFKDQQELIDAQEVRIAEVEKENVELRELVMDLKNSFDNLNSQKIELEGANGAILDQNIPNPFDGQTRIAYIVPESSNTASLHIFNTGGQLIKEVAINEHGRGVVNIEAQSLPQGTYTYSLIIDGEIVQSKQMILTK